MFLCFLGGLNTLSCFLTPKCYLCVVFVCSLEQIGRNRLCYSSICSSSFIPLGGTVGLPHYELSQLVGRLQTPHSTARCVISVSAPCYIFLSFTGTVMQDGTPENKARRRETGDGGTHSSSGGREEEPPHPNSPADGERVPPRASVLIHHD